MGQGTKIGWTEILGSGKPHASWNPLRATNKETGKLGWACSMHGPGCLNCYAQTLNEGGRFGGTGLPYTIDALDKIELNLMHNNGQTSIDWPLRAKTSNGIFPCSMTDWLWEHYPEQWSNYMLAVMSLAQHHIFMPLTKRWDRMSKMLHYFTRSGMGVQVPDTPIFDTAIMRAITNSPKWVGGDQVFQVRNSKHEVMLPWPPPNIFFGVTIVNDNEAFSAQVPLLAIKQLFPSFQTWISYEPALEQVDWDKHGYDGLVDWMVVGGESGAGSRRMDPECIDLTLAFGKKYDIPVYVKQAGAVLARELGLDPGKGLDLPEEYAVHQFPDVAKRYIPWR